MKKLEAPRGLTINFSPSPKQFKVWQTLQPNRCDKCGGELEMAFIGKDNKGNNMYEPRCKKCHTADIPEQVLIGGAAGGGKSFLGTSWLCAMCIQFPGIRMVVARKELKTLETTTWATMLDVLRSWGLEEDIHYNINHQKLILTFWNGSQIMALALAPVLSDPEYNWLGSLEITGGFIDEVSEILERAVEVLASRIRYKVAESFIVGKLLMSCNPSNTWIRNVFVQDDDGNPVKLGKGYRFLPFSLFDNPDEKFRNIYRNKLAKIRDKATRQRLLFGNWDFFDQNSLAAYWEFEGEKHLCQDLTQKSYSPIRPLILSFDFNVSPYMSCLPAQIDYENKVVYILREFIGKPEEKLNNSPAFGRYIADQLVKMGHIEKVLITGDPAGLARSTQTEAGVNNFTIIMKALQARNIRCTLQIFNTQPAQVSRLEFVNELFKHFNDWTIKIDLRCRKLTDDLINQKKNPDGTKEKKKFLMDNGTKAERFGHLSDCLDYTLCYYLNNDYNKYINGEVEIVTTSESGDMYDSFSY